MKKFRITENEEDSQKRLSTDLDLLLTPINSTIEEVISALENVDNYGSYVSNMRNKREIEAALIKHFGPTLPTHKKPLEKKQGFPFPPKTKQAVDDFIRSFKSKPNLLTYEVLTDKGALLFPTHKNTSKQNTKNIIKQVMDSAKIQYKLTEFEDMREFIEKKRMMELAGINNEIKVNEPDFIKYKKYAVLSFIPFGNNIMDNTYNNIINQIKKAVSKEDIDNIVFEYFYFGDDVEGFNEWKEEFKNYKL